MSGDRARDVLDEALRELAQAREHLDFSYARVSALPGDLKGATSGQLESVEAFTSRFARSVDLLVNKVLRSLDRAELLPQGTLLDVVNRAEKRGFVARSQELREMKDVRNMIAHDYAGTTSVEIFVYCRDQKATLDSICERVLLHAKKLREG